MCIFLVSGNLHVHTLDEKSEERQCWLQIHCISTISCRYHLQRKSVQVIITLQVELLHIQSSISNNYVCNYKYVVSRPRFTRPVTRENVGDSQAFEAGICSFVFAWIFNTSWHKIGDKGQNGGRGYDIDPQWSHSYYPCAYFGENWSRNAIARVLRDTDEYNWFYISTLFHQIHGK